MERKVYEWDLAGHLVRVSFLDPRARYFLRPLPKPVEGESCQLLASSAFLEEIRPMFPPGTSDAFVEYRGLIGLSSQLLLRYRCCVFHAAAFSWQGRAWLLTAPAGTGKTTQILNWQRLFPGEIGIISGDMPILEAREDGSVWVHPSSWNGKENLYGAPAAPLGGLILLRQGQEDRMLPLPPRDAVVPLLRMFFAPLETEEEIRQLASLLESVLLAAPCRKFVNLGGEASTRLLRDTLSGFLDKEDVT